MKLILILLIPISLLNQGCLNNKNNQEINREFIEKGQSIAKQTFDTLNKELSTAISEKGLKAAIDYCNLNASSITSIYEKEEITSISRTAIKFRNPANAPDSLEMLVLNEYGSSKERGDTLSHRLIVNDTEIHYFKPILLNNKCLLCHGDPNTEIQPEVLEQIKNKYPGDLATGFRKDDLRGMWHIVFNKK
jgi:hypothetical protein